MKEPLFWDREKLPSPARDLVLLPSSERASFPQKMGWHPSLAHHPGGIHPRSRGLCCSLPCQACFCSSPFWAPSGPARGTSICPVGKVIATCRRRCPQNREWGISMFKCRSPPCFPQPGLCNLGYNCRPLCKQTSVPHLKEVICSHPTECWVIWQANPCIAKAGLRRRVGQLPFHLPNPASEWSS